MQRKELLPSVNAALEIVAVRLDKGGDRTPGAGQPLRSTVGIPVCSELDGLIDVTHKPTATFAPIVKGRPSDRTCSQRVRFENEFLLAPGGMVRPNGTEGTCGKATAILFRGAARPPKTPIGRGTSSPRTPLRKDVTWTW